MWSKSVYEKDTGDLVAHFLAREDDEEDLIKEILAEKNISN